MSRGNGARTGAGRGSVIAGNDGPRLSSLCRELGATFYPLLEAFIERCIPVVLECPQERQSQGDQGAGELLAVGQAGGAIVVGRKDEGVLAAEQLLHAERAHPTQLLAGRRDGDRRPEAQARHAHGELGAHSGGSLGCGEVAPLAVGGEVGEDIPYRFRGGVDVNDGGQYCFHGGFHFWPVREEGWRFMERVAYRSSAVPGTDGGWRLRWSAGRGRRDR